MMAFFLCIFSVWLWGVTCFHIMFYLVLVSNWNYNELELSFIWCIILCPRACKLLFQKWRKGLYCCDHPHKQKSWIVVIFKVMKWIAYNEILWKTITLVQTCICFPRAVSILPVHMYARAHTHTRARACTRSHTHICTLLICWQACERLLAYRVEMKVKTKKVDGILNRLHVAMPAPRDEKARPPCIPGEKQSC